MDHLFGLRRQTAMRQLCAIGSTWLLVVVFTLLTAGDAQAAAHNSTKAPTVKEKALSIPPGSLVQVQLMSKAKLRGQIGSITNGGLTLKVANGNSIEDKTVAFAEVKSINQVGKGHSPAFWILIGVGAILALGPIVAGLGVNN